VTEKGRRGLAIAAVLVLLGLALVAAVSRARWVTAVPADPTVPGSARVALKGSALVPSAVPLALVAAAGLVAAVATGRAARGVVRVLASLVVVLAGLGLAWSAFDAAADLPGAFSGIEAVRQAAASRAVDPAPIRWGAGVGGLLLAAGGVAALVVGSGWPGLAARYERDPAAPRATAGPATAWDAIERGDDPTC
jgi:hypothetical protein